MAGKRLTRKEIVRQDRIQQTLTETSSWLVRNLNYLLLATGIVVLALLGVYLWQLYSQSVEDELQTKFSDALAMFHGSLADDQSASGLPGEEATPPNQTKYQFETAEERSEAALGAFRDLSEDYEGLRLGALARYYVALTLMDLEKPDQARSELEGLIAESEYPDINNMVRNSLVQIAVAHNDHEEAVAQLQKILDEPSPNFPQQVVLSRLAQSYEALGNDEEALKVYKQIKAEYAGTAAATESESRIKYLEFRGVSIEETDPPLEDEVPESQE